MRLIVQYPFQPFIGSGAVKRGSLFHEEPQYFAGIIAGRFRWKLAASCNMDEARSEGKSAQLE